MGSVPHSHGACQHRAMSSRPANPHPLIGIELARLACTLPVLLWHYQHFYFVNGQPVDFETTAQPLYDLFKPFYLYGYLSVQAFWCLSGFIFFWKYARPISQGQVPLSRFALLRFSRLYPLHLLTLLIVAAMSWRYQAINGSAGFVYPNQDAKHFVLQLFMASDWGPGIEWSYNGPIWSISVEILVYLLFYGLCRLGVTKLWMMLGLIGASGAVYALKLTPHPLVLCTFFFYLGALTCMANEAFTKRLTPKQQGTALGVALAVVAAGLALATAGRLRPMFFVALLTPVAIIALLHWVKPRSQRITQAIVNLGNMTYSSYLWHFPLQLLGALVFIRHPGDLPAQHPAWLLGYLALTYMLAALSYRFIEHPAQDWIRQKAALGRARATA
ncbi:MAG: acyltransferase [Rubrivivax sp.]|nr:MAG: acyltransferase [Rubrivivax sp.]